jgi:hypothetical protein
MKKLLPVLFTLALMGTLFSGCQQATSAKPTLTLTKVTTPYGIQVVASSSPAKGLLAAQPSGVSFSSADPNVVTVSSAPADPSASLPANTVAVLDSGTGLVTPVTAPPTNITVVATASDESTISASVPLTVINLVGGNWSAPDVCGTDGLAFTASTNLNSGTAISSFTSGTSAGVTNVGTYGPPVDSNGYPTTGSGAGGALQIGDYWIIGGSATIMINGASYKPGDWLIFDGGTAWGNKHYSAFLDWVAVDGAMVARGYRLTYTFPDLNTFAMTFYSTDGVRPAATGTTGGTLITKTFTR